MTTAAPCPDRTSSNNNAQVINNTAAKLTSFVCRRVWAKRWTRRRQLTSGGDCRGSGNRHDSRRQVTQRKVAAFTDNQSTYLREPSLVRRA